jgi:uncharacterized membrane protein YfcA
MLGIGGGLIFVPVLYYLLPLIDIPETDLAYYTIGTSLFAGSMGTLISCTFRISTIYLTLHPKLAYN